MKRFLVAFLLLSNWANAQLQPSNSKLYIRSSTARVATTNPADLSDPTKGITTVSYQDASGRSIQTVSYRTSPDLTDQVQGTSELDALGRPKLTYLPFKSPTVNGAFQSSYAGLAQSFYGDTAPFSEVDVYDPSPISSPVRSIAPGQVFQAGGKKGVVQNYETAGSGIRKYVIQPNGTVDGTQTYNNGDLIKTTLVDEDGNTSIEYKGGRSGRLLLVQQKDRNSTTYLTTAYVYDFMGRLCYVVPPKAYNAQTAFTESGGYFDDGIYATHYDGRGRVAESHVPGGGWTYTIYNELDQVVMSQDARQRETNLWEWVKYDGHGRTVMGGTYVTASPVSQSDMQGYFNASTVTEQFEERTTGNLYGYTNRSFPSQVGLSAANVTTANYYDNYFWVDNAALGFQQYRSARWTNVTGMSTGSLVKNLGNGQMLKSVVYYDDRGRVIQSYSENRFGGINRTDAVLNFAGDLLEERTVYRKPGQADLNVEGVYTYDHVGRQTGAAQKVNGQVTPIAQYVYDGIGRLSQKNLMRSGKDIIIEDNAQPDGDTDIANRYVLLDRGTYTAENGTYLAAVSPDALQKIDYTYTVRGELRGINVDGNGNISLLDGDVFGMKLDHAETSQTYNGKVAGQSWRTINQANNQPVNRSYTYSYDGYDRLQSAGFFGQGSENYALDNVSYDANGNIGNLQRNGLISGSSYGSIDNLGYTYLNDNVGNRLQGVEDNANKTKGFKDNNSNNDYTYYNDGSLKTDANKGITLIEYNYLGLPEKISFGANQRIENTYDASGMKLSQKIINGSTVTQTDYMGGLIYRNGSLETIYHDEGRVKIDNGNLTQQHYQFFITDHLGNNRIIIERLNATTAIVQETHYYPFGAVMEGAGVSGDWNFLFQGKEFVDGWGYDFHTRGYDAYIGRFMQIDGANQFASGYVGMGNMPTMGVDPDGQWVHLAIGAVVGGVANLGIKAFQGKINSWRDGFAAFGIGAVAGGVTAATGGAASVYATTGSFAGAFSSTAVASASTGLFGGAVAGTAGAATGGAIQGIGNATYFGDPYSVRDWVSGIGIGAVTGGIGGTIAAKFQGKHWLNGTRNRTGIAPNFGNSKWLKTNDGWKLSSAKGGDLTFQGVDGVGSLGGRNVGDVVGSNLPTTYYPPNNGAAGNWTSTYLRPGQIIDRYGEPGRFFSSAETAAGARSLPYNSNTNLYTKYEVLKPFQIQTSRIAPAFGEIGGGTQYLSPITSDILLKREIIRIVR